MKKGIAGLAFLLLAGLVMMGLGCLPTEKKPTTTENTDVVEEVVETVDIDSKLTNAAILADTNGQWAVSATASTTYNDATGDASWSAQQATGAPNVTKYADSAYAWAPKEKNKGIVTLELTYADPVYATNVRIFENLGSGATTKVELKDIDGVYHEAWTGTDPTEGLNYLQVNLSQRSYKSNTVRITLDTTKSPAEWVEVDAVQLVGTK